MRKLPTVLTVMALAALGTTLPVSTAHAATPCDSAWNGGATSRFMYAYDATNCTGFLGKDDGWDSNWADGIGNYQAAASNKASSILNKGTTLEVQFFNGTGTGWTGGYICLSRNEGFASSLADDKFSSGTTANNAISSHRWVVYTACGNNWAE
ncbi:hypothetical protein ACFWFI_02725 [Streptomyces sp. NPDC060209]|uniref:hypothetical protein n=1 Tax=Streptomyces sp. NPDC060209 TaxID=3347073 RepID=UPI0036474D8D